MLSFDTNILFHSLHAESPRHQAAREFFDSIQDDDRVALSELVLVELYGLLRNPTVSLRPLDPGSAVEVVSVLRRHPHWRLLSFPQAARDLHDRLWQLAAQPGFAFRRIYDARLALSLLDQGITEFATANVKDFKAMGFERVWDPTGSGSPEA